MSKYKILGVFTGKVGTLPNNFVKAAIKSYRPFITIKKDSIENDEVDNSKYHGGDMRVVKPVDYLEFFESLFSGLPVSKLHQQGYGHDRFSDLEFLDKCLKTGLMDKGSKPKVLAAFLST